MQNLFKGGRLNLIKSTLSSLPIYHVSLFVLSKQVSMGIEKFQRGFSCLIKRKKKKEKKKKKREAFVGCGLVREKTALGEIGDHLQTKT